MFIVSSKPYTIVVLVPSVLIRFELTMGQSYYLD